MAIPWERLKTKFHSIADELIDTINATDIILSYPRQSSLPDALGDLSVKPFNFDEYGGRVPIQSLPDRMNETGINLVNTPITETVRVRSYWVERNAKQGDGSKSFTFFNQRLKIISYTSDTVKLNNATSIELSGIIFKNTEVPKPYGFGKRYSVSYWEAFNG